MNTLKAQDSSSLRWSIPLIFLIFLASCDDTVPHFKKYQKAKFKTPKNNEVLVYIAESPQEQALGLSHIKPDQFQDNEAMLFPAKKMKRRQFWMPETHMDLDLFFMNENYYILDIHRSLKHFPTRNPESAVPRSKVVFSQHILEMKSSSPLAKELEVGTKLKLEKIK